MSILKSFFTRGRGGRTKAQAEIKAISVHDAHDRTSDGTLVLIDVRTPEEWRATGRPAGSVGVTLQDADFTAKVLGCLDGDAARAVAFTCRTGARAGQAAEKARRAGLTDIANMTGGFVAWEAARLPIDRGPF